MTRTRRLSLIASCIEYKQQTNALLESLRIMYQVPVRYRSNEEAVTTGERMGKLIAKTIGLNAAINNRIAKLEKGL